MTEAELLELIKQAAKDGRESLDLSSKGLQSLPPEIGQLTNLSWLYLRNNQLTSLPAEIGQLTNLSSLYLNYNQLTSLPSEIGKLTNLSSLNLSNNQLTSLPSEIGQLTDLSELYLSNNKLTSLPPEIGQLSDLSEIEIIDNQLTRLPSEFGQLKNLRELDLSNNQLTNLPSEFGQLKNLKTLNLSNNQLTSLPSEFGLKNLHWLKLSCNQITSLPPEIGQSNNLNTLDLKNNQLTSLPPEIGQLTKLSILDLSDNKLISLSPEIGQLTNLIELDISNNQLINLPPEFSKLTNLNRLDISNNQLTRLPPEITHRHWRKILSFLQQQLEQTKDYIYEAKLLIIGEGGAGKTTLAQKIKNPNYKLKPDEESTEGIDVITWKFPLDNGREFQINIWDFGGQQIYHRTHQFFLTKRSLYALVADSRKEDTDFYYWLNVVKLLTNESPLLIIKNEKQDREKDINDQQLKSDFTNLKEVLPTNLESNRGLDKILKQIKHYIQNLPHVGVALPAYWIKVREVLEKDNRDYISFDEFVVICKTQGFKQLEDILVLSGYLHDLGIFLHFQKDDLLRNTVILNPTWGTDGVYKVLDTKKVKDNLGEFNRQDLDNIWHEEKYASMRGELLRLMMNFKLCYEIPSKPNNYIAPQLLSANKSSYHWDEKNNLLLRYEYEFMPKGILIRFIVEMHRYIESENIVWQTGVVLNKDEARAEIIELYRYHKGEIRIRVMGKRKRDLLTTVRYELDKIHHSYELLKYKTLVPCNCGECKNNQSPYFYSWETLNRFTDKGKLEIQCQQSCDKVSVQELINDIYLGIGNNYRDDETRREGKYSREAIVYANYANIDLSGDNTGGNKNMSDRTFNVQNQQYIENNSGEVNWNKYTSNPEMQQSLNEIKTILDKLTQQHPNVTETEATNIIEAEFTTIQTENPNKWRNLRQQLLNKERWLNGGKAALVAATEHYIDNNIFYKMGLVFVDEFTSK